MPGLALLLLPLAAQDPASRAAPPFDWRSAGRKEFARIWKSDRPEDRAFVRSLRDPIDALERGIASLREDLLKRRYAERFLGPEKRDAFADLFASFRPYASPRLADLRALVPDARAAAAEMVHDPVFRCAEPLLGKGAEIASVYRATLRTLDLLPDSRVLFEAGDVAELFGRMALLSPAVERAAADAETLLGFSPGARAPKERVAQTIQVAVAGKLTSEEDLSELGQEAEKKAGVLERALLLPACLAERAEALEGLHQRLAAAEKRRTEAMRWLPPEQGRKAPPPDPEVAKLRLHERWKLSIDLLTECVAKDPTSTWGLYDLARSFDFRKSVGSAISCFERFLALYDPDGKRDDGFSRTVREYVDSHRRLGH
ncbi:MAG TPA: hypothetical protein VFI25_10830 [Planctomycetota bacterium]|nr:hypothetical protein [Planctomycetota bacterium]